MSKDSRPVVLAGWIFLVESRGAGPRVLRPRRVTTGWDRAVKRPPWPCESWRASCWNTILRVCGFSALQFDVRYAPIATGEATSCEVGSVPKAAF